jgi:hypothetical protein
MVRRQPPRRTVPAALAHPRPTPCADQHAAARPRPYNGQCQGGDRQGYHEHQAGPWRPRPRARDVGRCVVDRLRVNPLLDTISLNAGIK